MGGSGKRGRLAWHFRFGGRRVGRVLGDLEAEVMEIIWHRGSASIREVSEEVGRRRPRTFNTIMTIMNRLTEKGLLRREDRRGSYRYGVRGPRSSTAGRARTSGYRSAGSRRNDPVSASRGDQDGDADG